MDIQCEQKNVCENYFLFSGRKKKIKGFMGGFTMIAMMAQLFLGKLVLLAGAAFLLSKISLLFAVFV